jgi:hypothetical protein
MPVATFYKLKSERLNVLDTKNGGSMINMTVE